MFRAKPFVYLLYHLDLQNNAHTMILFSGPSLAGGTTALCQGPRASKGPRAATADCCKRRNLVS